MMQLLGYKLNQYQRERSELINTAQGLAKSYTQLFNTYVEEKQKWDSLADKFEKKTESVEKKQGDISQDFSSIIGSVLDFHGKKLSDLRTVLENQKNKLVELQEKALSLSERMQNASNIAATIINSPDVYDIAKSDVSKATDAADYFRRKYTLSNKEINKLIEQHLPENIDEETKTVVRNTVLKTLGQLNQTLLNQGLALERLAKPTGTGSKQPEEANVIDILKKGLTSRANAAIENIRNISKDLNLNMAYSNVDVSRPEQLKEVLDNIGISMAIALAAEYKKSSEAFIDFLDINPGDSETTEKIYNAIEKGITKENYMDVLRLFAKEEIEPKQLVTADGEKIDLSTRKTTANVDLINNLDFEFIGKATSKADKDRDESFVKNNLIAVLNTYFSLLDQYEELSKISEFESRKKIKGNKDANK